MKNPPACEQALRLGALAVGWEKERELATTSLESEYLHRKNRCEMLVGGDDISNDVSSIFHMVFNVCLHSHLFPILLNQIVGIIFLLVSIGILHVSNPQRCLKSALIRVDKCL